MQNLVIKVKKSIDLIEKEKGAFEIKCLIARDPNNVQWDLILSATWFEKDQMKRLNYLSQKILSDFDIDCMTQFSGIVTFESDVENDLTKSLLRIQKNNSNGLYNKVIDNDIILVETQMEQARLVIPLNQQSIT